MNCIEEFVQFVTVIPFTSLMDIGAVRPARWKAEPCGCRCSNNNNNYQSFAEQVEFLGSGYRKAIVDVVVLS